MRSAEFGDRLVRTLSRIGNPTVGSRGFSGYNQSQVAVCVSAGLAREELGNEVYATIITFFFPRKARIAVLTLAIYAALC